MDDEDDEDETLQSLTRRMTDSASGKNKKRRDRAAAGATLSDSADAEVQDDEELEAGMAVKKARVESRDPTTALIADVRSYFVSLGGRVPSRSLAKHFRRRNEAEGDAFKQMLVNVLRLVATRVALADGSIEYVLKATKK